MPSGRFCKPMPSISVTAPAKPISGEAADAPKATPTASPSGILCRVMASTSSALRGRREGLPSAKPSRGCRCGNRISRRRSATAPPRKPKATGTKRHAPHPAPASSSAGSSRDQNEAASITPAANPSMISSERRENSRGENTAAAPRDVKPQVTSPASRPMIAGCCSMSLLLVR